MFKKRGFNAKARGMGLRTGKPPMPHRGPHGGPPQAAGGPQQAAGGLSAGNPAAGTPGGMAGGSTASEQNIQQMLGQQASMKRISALQQQLGVPTSPQGQF